MLNILNLLNSGSKLIPGMTGGDKAASGDNPTGFMAYLTAVMGQIESEAGAAGSGKNILTGQKTPNSQAISAAGENFPPAVNFAQTTETSTDNEKIQGLDFLMALMGIPQEEQESLREAFNNINAEEGAKAGISNAAQGSGANNMAQAEENAHAPEVKNTYFFGSSRISDYVSTTEEISATEIYMQNLKGMMKATERVMAMIKPKDELDEKEETNLAVEELAEEDGENTLFKADVDKLMSVMPGKKHTEANAPNGSAAAPVDSAATATASVTAPSDPAVMPAVSVAMAGSSETAPPALADEIKYAVKAEIIGKSEPVLATEDVTIDEMPAGKETQAAEKAVNEKTAKETLKVDELEISSLKDDAKKAEPINDRRADMPKAEQAPVKAEQAKAASAEQLKADQAKADVANKPIDAENKAVQAEAKPAEEKTDARQYATKPAESENRQAEARPVRAEAKDAEIKQTEARATQSDKTNQADTESVEAMEAEMDAGADNEGRLADNKGEKGGKDNPENKFGAVMKEKNTASVSQTQNTTTRGAAEVQQPQSTFTERADARPVAENVQQQQSVRTEERILQWQSIRDAASLAKMIHQAGQNGVNKLTVRLNPEHLGRLEIQLTEAGGRLNARILASSPESRTLLASAGDAIRQQLQEKGIHIDNMDFNFADSAAKEQNGQDQGRGASERKQHFAEGRGNEQDGGQNDETRSPVKEGIYA